MPGIIKQCVLVIDQGSHSSRAMVLDASGDVLAVAAVPVKTVFPQVAFVEQSPDDILQSIQFALQQLASQLDAVTLESIQSAGLIVQRSSLLACSRKNLQAITPVISWQDTRNKVWLDKLAGHHPAIKLITGLRPNAHYGASKIRWLLDNDITVQCGIVADNLLFVPLAAYLACHLTESHECVVDPVIASRTLLTALGEMQWHDGLLQLFGIEKKLLPRIVASDHVFGNITLAGKSLPLALLGGDQSFIPFACGMPIAPDIAYVNVGTGAFVQMQVDGSSDIQELLYSPLVITASEKVLVLEGTVNAAATALDWLWGINGKQLDYEAIEQALLSETAPPVFINTLAGTGSPYWLPASEPFFLADANLAAKTVAVIESIVFALMDNIGYLQQANVLLHTVIIGGGISRSNGFCQKLANISGLKVVRPLMNEISSCGAAFFLLRKSSVPEVMDAQVFFPVADKLLQKRYEETRQYFESRSHL